MVLGHLGRRQECGLETLHKSRNQAGLLLYWMLSPLRAIAPPRATDSHRQQRAGLRECLSRANQLAQSPHPRPLVGLTHPGPCSPDQPLKGQAPGNLGKHPCLRATDTIQVGQPLACSPPLPCCFPGKPPSLWTATHPGAALCPSQHGTGLPSGLVSPGSCPLTGSHLHGPATQIIIPPTLT